jgi:NADPH-dependent curcumin reductase CurA
MSTATTFNQRWYLHKRPIRDLTEHDFALREERIPEPNEGEVLIRNIYLSLDPTLRLWAREHESYMPSVALGEVMRGFALGIVEKSRNEAVAEGGIVTGIFGWETYSISNCQGADLLQVVDMDRRIPLNAGLALFHHIGLTAYFGVLDVLAAKPGETLVVSAGAGAVGSIAVQIGKIVGCRVIAIAGTDEKCQWLTDELGADAAINYKTQSLPDALSEACPDGVDCFFDNVGGPILEAVLGLINMNARIALCGAISQYGTDDKAPGPHNFGNLLWKRARAEGFIVSDYAADKEAWAKAYQDISRWHLDGKLSYRVHTIDGLANAARAVTKLFNGTNKGKLLVRVSDEPQWS